ncbi:hypothetical protein AMS68_004866 [Peltaster fructicola]|uniref:Uncharacterized protein n=1 Tax=Peltaster fructicola TaxID=286661 RepID=A0A6H0XXK3_9PEZI|nr:hypothetical protein AMS68_004866 [Peltaster fructicola]
MSSIAAVLSQAPFRVGQKQVYLPDFSITLHRRSHLGPRHATFTVPLWFSKLDLRDYLFHAYDPSYLKEDYAVPTRRYYRPQSIKRMTVELESPFEWPEPPKDLDPWQEKYSKAMKAEQDKEDKRRGPQKDLVVDEDHAAAMREQALELLKGTKTWQPYATTSPGPVLSR